MGGRRGLTDGAKVQVLVGRVGAAEGATEGLQVGWGFWVEGAWDWVAVIEDKVPK